MNPVIVLYLLCGLVFALVAVLWSWGSERKRIDGENRARKSEELPRVNQDAGKLRKALRHKDAVKDAQWRLANPDWHQHRGSRK